jgi:cytoskeleton protein RodZ
MKVKFGDRQPADASGSAARVGAELRAARENIGWTLPAIAAHLRIRLPYLEAIEEGRIADLPGNAYALGFVRAYAKQLGLDPEEIARRFRTEVAEVNRKTELSFPAPVPQRGLPAGAAILLGLLIAIGGYIAWYRVSSDAPSTELVRPVPERLAELVPAAPPPPKPAAETPVDPAPTVIAAPAAKPEPAATPAPPPPAAPPNPTEALPEGTRLVLRAKADAWMQVRDRQGTVLLNRVLRAGETWPAPPKITLLLTTGNAGGTEILVDGKPTPSLGGDGMVRRDLLLDPDGVRDGKLAPVLVVKPVVKTP